MALSFHDVRQYSNRKIFASLAAITVVALASTVSMLYCLHVVLQTRQESIQITKIQTRLTDFYTTLLRAESAQRTFLLTGDDARLKPYDEAVAKVPRLEQQLETLSAAYSYAPQVNQLRPLAEDRLAALRQGIETRRQEGVEAAAALVLQGRGQHDMDRISKLVLDDIGKQQAADLAAKRALATNFGGYAYLIAGTMLPLTGALAVLVYYLFLQAIKAERALDQAKDEFVSLASHQLRTPATGIKSILSMLQSEDVGRLNKQQQYMIGRAIESNERGLRVVDELLNVARADAGRLVLKPAVLDLREVIEAAAAEQRRVIEAKGQKLTLYLPSHPARIVADEEKLFMAVGNLIDNASKYTNEGGSIKIRVRDHHKTVSIEVSDTGVGIEKEELAHIFDRFQRAHGILMSGVEGTGLGLYLTRRIIELHSGTIEVYSREGEGSTFTLILPRKGQPGAA